MSKIDNNISKEIKVKTNWVYLKECEEKALLVRKLLA